MPIQSHGQSVSAQRGNRYTKISLYDEPLSTFAFMYNLRRYTKGWTSDEVPALIVRARNSMDLNPWGFAVLSRSSVNGMSNLV